MKKPIVVITLLLFVCFKANCQSQLNSRNALLKDMTNEVVANRYAKIHGILIAKNGKTLYEHYFNGFTRDSLHDSRSSFKSITSLLVGIAIDKGFIKDLNQKVYSFFPEYKTIDDDLGKKEMTIKNLLEMESGFDCDEFSDNGVNCENTMDTTKDWVKFSLGLPMKNKPGKVWAYTSCDPMIISGILTNAAHMSVMDFADQYLFRPMGITHYKWTVDPAGHAMTAGSFYILPEDMLKIGCMVEDNGVWNGKRIVSAKWIIESTHTAIPIPDFSFVKISKSQVAIPQQAYYGYYWYSERVKTKDFTENVLFASGNGGQYIMIIKRLNLVVVFTQGNYDNWRAKRAFDILAKYILPVFEV
jgi:CubicO group peptidase (beta-lactamase class C family)